MEVKIKMAHNIWVKAQKTRKKESVIGILLPMGRPV